MSSQGGHFSGSSRREGNQSNVATIHPRATFDVARFALGAPEPVFYYYRGPLPAEALWLGFAASPERLESRLAGALAGTSGASRVAAPR